MIPGNWPPSWFGSIQSDCPDTSARITLGTDVGGCPDAYPVGYKILALKDGVVLKLTDALGRKAEVALSADDARLLALGLLGALPRQSVSGILGAR